MMPLALEGDATVPALSSFGFQIRCQTPLRFVRSGGGAETLEVAVVRGARKRPTTAPLADWSLTGPGPEVRAALYPIERRFEVWGAGMGAFRIDPPAGRVGM